MNTRPSAVTHAECALPNFFPSGSFAQFESHLYLWSFSPTITSSARKMAGAIPATIADAAAVLMNLRRVRDDLREVFMCSSLKEIFWCQRLNRFPVFNLQIRDTGEFLDVVCHERHVVCECDCSDLNVVGPIFFPVFVRCARTSPAIAAALSSNGKLCVLAKNDSRSSRFSAVLALLNAPKTSSNLTREQTNIVFGSASDIRCRTRFGFPCKCLIQAFVSSVRFTQFPL